MTAVAACGSTSGTSAGGSGPLKIYDLGGWSGATAGVYAPWKAVANATAEEINKSGGIDGRNVEIVFCDTNFTVAGSFECGRQAAADHTIGIINFAPDSAYLTFAEQKKIPVVPPLVDSRELNSTQVFAIAPQSVGITTGLPALGKANGCKNMAMIMAGQGADNQKVAGGYFNAAIKRLGMKGNFFTTESVPDMSPVVAKALESKPDCIAVHGLGPDWPAIVNAIEQSGANVQIYAHTAQLNADVIKSINASILPKLHVISEALPPTAVGQGKIDDFNAMIAKYSSVSGNAAKDGNSVLQYTAIHLFVDAARKAKNPADPASVSAALAQMSNYVSGTYPPVDFAQPASNPAGPRLFQQYMFNVKFVAGNPLPILVDPHSFNIFTGAQGPTVNGN